MIETLIRSVSSSQRPALGPGEGRNRRKRMLVATASAQRPAFGLGEDRNAGGGLVTSWSQTQRPALGQGEDRNRELFGGWLDNALEAAPSPRAG